MLLVKLLQFGISLCYSYAICMQVMKNVATYECMMITFIYKAIITMLHHLKVTLNK